MQFHIRTLLVVTFVVAVLCGLVFASPPIVCIPVLCTVLWVCPAVWLNGIIYGRGAWRPFFIGGFIAGFGPHLAALYYSYMIIVSLFEGGSIVELFDAEGPFTNLITAAILLGPGVFAFLGGISGATTYWMLQPPKKQLASGALAADEYLVVSGRLTTAPAERTT
jgi:hypothetical protein